MASPGYELAERMLRKDPKVRYADVKSAADKDGLSLPPIVYGSAKRALGLTSSQTKSSPRRKTTAAAKKKRTSRTQKAVTSSISDVPGVEAVLVQIQTMEEDRERMRTALEQMRGLLDDVLRES